jgi:hypothetical protein
MSHAVTEPGHGPGDLLQSLLTESQRLRNDVQERERRQRKTNILMAGGIAIALVMLIALIILLVQSRQRGADTRALVRSGNITSEQIADCTKPGGACYERGKQQTAAALQQLLNAQIIVQNCADITDTEAQLRVCVSRRLADPAGPQPSADPVPSPSPSVSVKE